MQVVLTHNPTISNTPISASDSFLSLLLTQCSYSLLSYSYKLVVDWIACYVIDLSYLLCLMSGVDQAWSWSCERIRGGDHQWFIIVVVGGVARCLGAQIDRYWTQAGYEANKKSSLLVFYLLLSLKLTAALQLMSDSYGWLVGCLYCDNNNTCIMPNPVFIQSLR